ncbi:MAG: type II toxin-antitoxin system VapC family toxin [Solirubrobacteraceae bacterium]
MRLLLDTHAAIWWLSDDRRLGAGAQAQMGDDSNAVLLSGAVVWEVAIKRSLGKLDTPEGFAPRLLEAGAIALAVSVEHAAAVERLPQHHRDPFDRLLVSQALIERATIVSDEAAIRDYDVPVLW